MAPTVTITEHTTTATKYAGVCMQMWDAKSSTFAGNQEQVRCEWRITSAPAGWSYRYVQDPRDGAMENALISIEDYVEGWVAAIFPDAAGNYTVEFRITEYDGTQATATDTVTIAAQSGFTEIDCTASTDLQTALSTIESGGGSNYIVNLAGDVTYDITSRVTDVFTNVVFQWDGTGTEKPVIDLADNTSNNGMLLMDDGSENVAYVGLKWIDSSKTNTSTADQTPLNMFTTTTPVKDMAIVECESDDGYSLSSSFFAETYGVDILMWDVNAQTANQSTGTGIVAGGSDVVAIGGYCGKVLVERPHRVSQGSLTLIGHRVNTPHKDAVRISGSSSPAADFCTIYRCKIEVSEVITVGSITTQPSNAVMVGLNTATPGSVRIVDSYLLSSSTTDARTMKCYEENDLSTPVTARGTFMSGCVCEVKGSSNTGSCVGSSANGQRHTFVNNTMIGYSDTANTSILDAEGSDLVIVESNYLIYDGPTPASAFNDELVNIANATTLSVRNNVIDKGTNVNTKPYRFDGLDYNFTNWEAADADIADNTEATVTLDSNYEPSSTTAADIPDGVFTDYYLNDLTPGDAGVVGAAQSVPTVPTVSTLTPANDATGVADTTTLVIVFSENMQSGSGTIELRRTSDDTVLDSILASDAAINFGDRTEVTLTGLSLSGQTGDVYVYIPAGAFVSLDDGTAFAGFTDSTGWEFTVGAAADVGGMRSRLRSRQR